MAQLPKVPVLFRRSGSRGDTPLKAVTAVFPTLDANPGYMACYAHYGQHGECSPGWYHGTRAATITEYAPLLDELRAIYEADPDPVELVVYKRRPRR